jgi:regulator of PEP synthase PpsR (kinase-PPPase family)
MTGSGNKRRGQVRHIYYVSDRTAKTAELNGESLLSQFPSLNYQVYRVPFADKRKISALVEAIKSRIESGEEPPLIFSTLVDERMRNLLASSGAFMFDIFGDFITGLEKALGSSSNHRIGVAHEDFEERESSDYQRRFQALDFTLSHDDGLHPRHYDQAEVIVVGVSRSAKTPVCLYLAMNFFVRAANFPLAGDDLENETLPDFLRNKREKVVGLHISPERLRAIREKRRPGSEYSSLRNCRRETRLADEIFRLSKIPVYDSSTTSVEEIAVAIVRDLKLLV